MTSFLNHVSAAALPVGIGLLILTALARAALWVEDPNVRRLAYEYLEPLSIWCLVADGVHTVAMAGAGHVGGGALAIAVAIAVAAVWLPWAVEDQVSGQPGARARRVPDQPPSEPEPPPQPVRPLAPGEALWARPAGEPRRSADLWQR